MNRKVAHRHAARRLPALPDAPPDHVRVRHAARASTTATPTRASWSACSADLPAKVNLIPFNPWPGSPLRVLVEQPHPGVRAIVEAAGYATPVRTPRGRDILAACGQLHTASGRQRRLPNAA